MGFHRHNSEVYQELSKIKNNISFTFTPHLSPMFRGILSTIYIDLRDNIKVTTIQNTLNKFYNKKPFVKISKFNAPISTNSVINTNNCLISVCKTKNKNKIVLLSAIDNLIKGGAGQAIQNMNIFFNFLESKGLRWKEWFL